jgi:plastocyanin
MISNTNEEPTMNPEKRSAPKLSKRTTKILAVLLVVLVLIAGYIILRPPAKTTHKAVAPAAIAPAIVNITASGFSPITISVRSGQAVVWTNTDSSPHAIASSGPHAAGFKTTQLIYPKASFSFIFNTRGSYTYQDIPTRATGIVVVK